MMENTPKGQSSENSGEKEPFDATEIAAQFRKNLDALFNGGSAPLLAGHDRFDLQRSIVAPEQLLPEGHQPILEGRITPVARRIAGLFFHSLLDKIREARRDTTEEGRQRLQTFLVELQERLFAYSPNITQYLDIPDQLLMASAATRIPEVQGWFGSTMTGELVYNLSICSDSIVEKMRERLEKCSLPELLDTLHYSQTVAAQAIANGQWAKPAVQRITELIRKIRRSHPSAIAQYAAALAAKRVLAEHYQPSLGVMKFRGNPADGRVVESMPRRTRRHSRAKHVRDREREGNGMASDVVFDPPLHPRQRVLRVASDAVAVLDHSTLPRSLGMFEQDSNSQSNGAETVVRQRDYEEILKDPHIHPFPGNSDGELPLLLQHLHRPALYELIEEDLGIDLAAMPLRVQIHLLRFLADKDAETFSDLRTLLRQHPEDAQAILTSFLACAQDKELGSVILSIAKIHGGTQALTMYAQVAAAGQKTSEEMLRLYREANPDGDLSQEKIYQSLLARANLWLRNANEQLHRLENQHPAKRTDLIEALSERLRSHDERIALTSELVAALPREEVAKLNLSDLSTVELKSMPAEDLLADPDRRDLLDEMTRTVAKNFPRGDAKDFRKRYLRDPSAEMTYATCGGKLLSFFGTTRMPDGTRYLDWYNTSPTSPIKGLAEATAHTAINHLQQQDDFYLVAKPHVRSHEIFSRVGFVTFGTTDPGEYRHRYLRCRKVQQERNNDYIGKQLTSGDTQTISSVCRENDRLYPLSLRGTDLQVCKVEFAGMDHENDIAPGTKENFLYQTVATLCADNAMVMSAYIPDKRNSSDEWRQQKRQSYYCVFEPSRLTPERLDLLNHSIHKFHTQTTSPEEES